MRPISSHLHRTSLANKRFIEWHKAHWEKRSSYLFIFQHWKGDQLYAQVMARASISWLDIYRKYNDHLIGDISNSNFKLKFQIFKFKLHTTLCFYFYVCRFLLQNVFFSTHEHFCFILVDAFGFSVFWFHKDREVTKNLFTLAENNFGERTLSCTRLNFGEILFAGTKRTVRGGQYCCVLPARVLCEESLFRLAG